MIDGAVDVTHPALAGRKLRFRSFHRAGRGPGPKEHGTAVAAMLVGRSEWGGLLPGAELRAGNMFEQKKTGQVVGSAIGLLKSIDWLIAERVHAVNLSVAGSDNKIVRRAFEKGARGGLILVAAAGNWGRKGNRPAFPAAYRQVIAVTAFVNKKLVYSSANTGRYIEFAAPGVKIWTAVPGGGRFLTGTSMAAPFVTSLMGLANARGRFKNAKALRKAMRGRVEDLGRRGRDEVFGFGFITLKPPC